jgi:hypothetical protein
MYWQVQEGQLDSLQPRYKDLGTSAYLTLHYACDFDHATHHLCLDFTFSIYKMKVMILSQKVV